MKLKYILYLLPKAIIFLIPINIFLFFVSMIFEVISIAIFVPLLSAISGDQKSEQVPLGFILEYFSIVGEPKLILMIACSIFLIKSVVLSGIFWFQNIFVFKVLGELNEITLSAFLKTEYRKHQQSHSSAKIQTIVTEIELFCGYIIMPSLLVFTEAFVIIGLACFLLYVQPVEAISIIILMVSVYFIFALISRPFLLKYASERLKYAELKLHTLQEILSSIKEIFITRTDVYFLKKYQYSNRRANIAARKSNFISNVIRYWLEIIFLVSVLLSVLILEYFKIGVTDFLLSYGIIFIAFIRLGPSISRLITGIQNLRYGGPSITKLFESLSSSDFSSLKRNDESRFINKKTSLNALQIKHASEVEIIKVDNLWFSFEKQLVLHGVSFEIKKGEILGIFGPSGSGKSTLMDIMMGFQEASKGKISVNLEERLYPEILEKSSFQYVAQNVFILDDDIYSNVAFGIKKNKIDKKRIDILLKKLRLCEFISKIEHGKDRHLGENGKALSGGQRQRIGIARALYRQPSVLFMDEPTSSLDDENKNSVIEAISDISEKITTVIVTHDKKLLNIFTKTINLKPMN